MATTLRRPHATPSARLILRRELRASGGHLSRMLVALRHALFVLFDERIPEAVSGLFGARGLRLLLNIATAALVVSLPFAAAAAPQLSAATTDLAPVAQIASLSGDAAPRAETLARGISAATRSVITVAAQDVRPVEHYVVKNGDTLSGVADQFQVALDDLAFANGIEDEGTLLHVGNTLTIPPGRGALYTVTKSDTVAAVAQRFKVDPAAIMAYNRLYFEPEHFAPDQLIFVPGAEVPAMKRVTVSRSIGNIPTSQLPQRTGRLAWPVNGVITQYFWWGHTGVDIAAPYGTPIGASDDGVVVATGWVAVGGLRVCVQHADGFKTCYYHTSAVYVSPGETVKRGQMIAAIGLTGVTTGPHVHWEVWLNGVQVNGLLY